MVFELPYFTFPLTVVTVSSVFISAIFYFLLLPQLCEALAGFMSFLVFSQGSPLLFFSPLICQVFFSVWVTICCCFKL